MTQHLLEYLKNNIVISWGKLITVKQQPLNHLALCNRCLFLAHMAVSCRVPGPVFFLSGASGSHPPMTGQLPTVFCASHQQVGEDREWRKAGRFS